VWVDSAFLVIGGSSDARDSRSPGLTTGFRLDSTTGAWTPIAPAPTGLLQSVPHVVLAGVLYVLSTTYAEVRKGADEGTIVCGSQEFLAYRPATDEWSKLPLPAGECSLDPSGLVATGDAVVALSNRSHTTFRAAVDAVFDPATKAWTVAASAPPKDVFRWATATPAGLLVVAEPLPREDGYTGSSPATPAVSSWDYRANVWNRIDHPGSDSLDWGRWTGRVQDASGPVYYQDGNLLVFDLPTGTFKRKTPSCGGERCSALNSGAAMFTGTGASDLGTLTDGWTLGGFGTVGSAYLLRPASSETKKVVLPPAADPGREVMDPGALAGGPGMMLSCPLFPDQRPKAQYVEDLGATPAPLTQNGRAGTGQPGAMIRAWVVAAPGFHSAPELLAVSADGTWAYSEGSERNQEATVKSVEYVHKQEMQPYCYLLRY
jgi:hypothetical protein